MKYPRWLDTKDGTNLREVAPSLFVGGLVSFLVGEREHGLVWDTVIDVAGVSATSAPNRISAVPAYERHSHAGPGSTWYSVKLDDGEAIPAQVLDQAYDLVSRGVSRGPVLLQCRMGLSRSASVAYAMLRTLYRLPHEEALRRIQTPALETHYPLPVTLASAMGWARHKNMER